MIELKTCLLGTTTLGRLIDALSNALPSADVQFDFCSCAPTTLASYRGYYDHLALGWAQGALPTVAVLLAECREALGKPFEGWKGGSYTMWPDSPVWVANRGETGSTAIVGVMLHGRHSVVIATRWVDE